MPIKPEDPGGKQAEEDRLPPAAFENSIGVQFIRVPGGAFHMGSNDGRPDEQPVRRVEITRPFYLGVTEVTNAQWAAVMGDVPSRWKDEDHPVERVSWSDAVKFCETLSELPDERQAGRFYRLPTEAEWEYACRAGTDTRYSCGDGSDDLGDFAWFGGNAEGQTHRVGQKTPNPWGLHDMHGNVWEWCSDWYGPYAANTTSDPMGPVTGSVRVFRGGSWIHADEYCRAAYRYWDGPSVRDNFLGFRLVLELSEASSRDLRNE